MLSTKAKMRIARALNLAVVGARKMTGLGSVVETRRFGVNWQLDLNEAIDLALYLGKYQNISQRTKTEWLHPGVLAVDIGANIGAHGLRIAKMIGADGRVVCIEPTDFAYAKLTANARLNPELTKRLILVQAALTDGSGSSADNKFYSRWPLRRNGAALHAQHLGHLEQAQGARFVSLDALLDELRAADRISGRVSFVKIDVDGHELDVISGGRATLSKDKPAILIEIAPHVQDEVPGRFEKLVAMLQTLGYCLEDHETGEPLSLSAPALRAMIAPGASIDVIARPA